MKARDRYLTGILLILIGVLVGSILTVYQSGNWINDNAEVRFTEVKRSDQPLYTDSELESLDARFLFKSVAEKITPTVVYIETVVPMDGRSMPDDENHEEENDFFDRFMQRRARTVGSGVIISGDGYILTNYHVIEGAINDGIRVVLNDKRMFSARIVGTDPTTDLAVIKVDAENLPSIVVGDSDKVDVGEWVLAIGNPFRLRSTVTAGIVSALSRDVQIINDQMRVESFIQTDAAINRGNSGGALVNTSGELIGINTAIASQSGNYQGYGFAVPSNLASKVAGDIIQYGEVRRALLGVSIVSVDAIRAEELGMDTIRGVEIMTISPGGAADTYGLQRQDVILEVNGTEVNESNELQEKIAVLHPGETVNLTIWRDGNILDRSVKLGILETADEELSSNNYELEQEPEGDNDLIQSEHFDLGFTVMELVLEEEKGRELVVTGIDSGSEADRKGLKEGYVISRVGDQKVEDLETLSDLIGRSLALTNSVMIEIRTEEGAKGFYQLSVNSNQ